eukprot:g66345.t1
MSTSTGVKRSKQEPPLARLMSSAVHSIVKLTCVCIEWALSLLLWLLPLCLKQAFLRFLYVSTLRPILMITSRIFTAGSTFKVLVSRVPSASGETPTAADHEPAFAVKTFPPCTIPNDLLEGFRGWLAKNSGRPDDLSELHLYLFPWTHHIIFHDDKPVAGYSTMEVWGVRIWANWASSVAQEHGQCEKRQSEAAESVLKAEDILQYAHDREWSGAITSEGQVRFLDWGPSNPTECSICQEIHQSAYAMSIVQYLLFWTLRCAEAFMRSCAIFVPSFIYRFAAVIQLPDIGNLLLEWTSVRQLLERTQAENEALRRANMEQTMQLQVLKGMILKQNKRKKKGSSVERTSASSSRVEESAPNDTSQQRPKSRGKGRKSSENTSQSEGAPREEDTRSTSRNSSLKSWVERHGGQRAGSAGGASFPSRHMGVWGLLEADRVEKPADGSRTPDSQHSERSANSERSERRQSGKQVQKAFEFMLGLEDS